MTLTLLKFPEVCERMAIGPTSAYAAVRAGTLTPPVKTKGRASAWPSHEIDTLNAAIIAGKSDAAIRVLVAELLAERPKLLAIYRAQRVA